MIDVKETTLLVVALSALLSKFHMFQQGVTDVPGFCKEMSVSDKTSIMLLTPSSFLLTGYRGCFTKINLMRQKGLPDSSSWMLR